MKKAIFTIIVSKIGQRFQISSEFKLNEGMTLSKSTCFYFKYVIDMSKSGLAGKPRQVYCFYCTRATLISKPRHFISIQVPRQFEYFKTSQESIITASLHFTFFVL